VTDSSKGGADAALVGARLGISPEAVQTYLDAGLGKLAGGVVRSLHTTIKPIGAACNLDCNYCYYLSKEELLDHDSSRRMSDEHLERFIVEYIGAQDVPEVVFTWHGGEPTLLGLRFFRKVVELQQKHCPSGRRIANDLQTNGTLLDDEWGAFLAEYGFLVGLSVDGPAELHNTYRPTKKGRPSFEAVLAGARTLQRHGVQFSTLTTVNRKNALEPLTVYRFLRDELGSRFMQFIPCVEPKGFERNAPSELPGQQLVPASSLRVRPGNETSVVTDWSVDPDDWGSFLSTVFDEWYSHDQGRVRINLFESLFEQLQGRQSLMCTSSPVCGKNIALEHDGRVYSCDHFVYPKHHIGTLGEGTLAQMAFSEKQLEFGLDKHRSLPEKCRSCRYLNLCWGECPRTRILKTSEGEGNLSYLCSGWLRFFDDTVPRARRVAQSRDVIRAHAEAKNEAKPGASR
jgi:uncharacterized protein